jgi:monoamine oxidase
MASDRDNNQQFMKTSGQHDAVWIHKEPYENRPKFGQLNKDLDTDVCIIGSGIAGISVAEQLVKRGLQVVMVEARDILSGVCCFYAFFEAALIHQQGRLAAPQDIYLPISTMATLK